MHRALIAWWTGRSPTRSAPAEAPAPPVRRARAYNGEYLALHVYLRDRFADRIILTFSQIEDLLGFALPPAARLESGWWREPSDGGAPTTQAEAWQLASRTAEANMPASSIVFERQVPPRVGAAG
ncbi:MAG: hypothetical protein ABIX28_18365 [Vicinamibacterales bacterium]